MHHIRQLIIMLIIYILMRYKGSLTDKIADFINDFTKKENRKQLIVGFLGFSATIFIFEFSERLLHLEDSLNLLGFYLLLYVSIVIHELGHYFVAKFYQIPVKWFVVGNGWTLIKIGKFRFKLFPFSGYVHLGETRSVSAAIQVLSAGVIIVLLTLPLMVFILKIMSFSTKDIQYVIFLVISLVLYNLMPFIPKTDGHQIYRILKHLAREKKNENQREKSQTEMEIYEKNIFIHLFNHHFIELFKRKRNPEK
ncbi:MAG: site-2 protease family protein [Clostridia bacterium]|nr:site-2 protease family protein [Clostridia bacterium]